MSGRYEVQVVPPDEGEEALALLLRRFPPEGRPRRKEALLQRLTTDRAIPLELWRVVDRHPASGKSACPRVVAAGLLEHQPGGTSMGSAPVVLNHRFLDAGTLLLRKWKEVVRSQGRRVLQILAEDPLLGQRQMLRQAGIRRLTSLLYMCCEVGESLEEPPWDGSPAKGGLLFEPLSGSPTAWPRLAAVVEKTYIGSLDCPEVSGLRNVEETLTAYRLAGAWRADLWFIVRLQEQEIGCLLLGDRPTENCLELVYMGLLPEYRGHGFGSRLVEKAKSVTVELGRSRLVAAVDIRNWPAIRVYEHAGFRSVARADVFQEIFIPPNK